MAKKTYGSRDIQIQARIRSIAQDIAMGNTVGMANRFMALWGLKATQINHYIRQAKPIAKEIQEDLLRKQDAINEDQMVTQLKAKIISKLDRMTLLTTIAEGTIEITTKRAVWNAEDRRMQIVSITQAPEARDRMKAIEILNAMDGSNAPIKTDNRHQVQVAAAHRVVFEDYEEPTTIKIYDRDYQQKGTPEHPAP